MSLSRRTRGRTSPPRRNPPSDAAEMYERFHGTPSEREIIIKSKEHYHHNLTALGEMVQLKVLALTDKHVEIDFDEDEEPVYLCCDESGRQLFIEGGDQFIDLDKIGMGSDKWLKDHMVLGICYEVTYQTRKKFDSFRLTDYYHHLGEETKVEPYLNYDTRNQKLSIVGGQYEIKPEGIVN